MTTLLIATRNAHKVREMSRILGADFRCLDLGEFPGAPAAIEDADTFAGNAKKKVLCLAEWLEKNRALVLRAVPEEASFFIMADDSGLEVDALGGAPGVHSARFAAPDAPGSANAPDSANNAKLLRMLEGVSAERRTARFRCVLAVLRFGRAPDQIILFDGVCEGRISAGASGRGGFGYDPLFVPDGCAQSFAELGEDIKNQLSHRGRALARLRHGFGK